jgi:polyferredoxin
VLAPPLDLFRFDLTAHHFYLFGMHWTLGIDDFIAKKISATEVSMNITVRGGLPILAVIGIGIGVSWKYGRWYCGWLCPHYSVVETINRVMFTCTQCVQCVEACQQVQAQNPHGTLLKWVKQECALDKSARDFGHHPNIPAYCFESERHDQG